MVVLKVATIRVGQRLRERRSVRKPPIKCGFDAKAANATSTIAIDTHRKPSRDAVIVTLIEPNDIASIEAIAAATERNSKTARLTRWIKCECPLAPRTQRKKTTQII